MYFTPVEHENTTYSDRGVGGEDLGRKWYEEGKLYTLYYQTRVYGNLPSSPETHSTPVAGNRMNKHIAEALKGRRVE